MSDAFTRVLRREGERRGDAESFEKVVRECLSVPVNAVVGVQATHDGGAVSGPRRDVRRQWQNVFLQVAIDILVRSRWWRLSIHSVDNVPFIIGTKQVDGDSGELFVPLLTGEATLSIDVLGHMFNHLRDAVYGVQIQQLTLAVVSADATVSYYVISDGVSTPEHLAKIALEMKEADEGGDSSGEAAAEDDEDEREEVA